MVKIICKSKNGQVFKCSTCKLTHFEYKNLNFNFTNEEFKHFSNYFLNLDGLQWELKNANCFFKRKIFVPAGLNNFNILLNNNELLELKSLFSNTDMSSQAALSMFNCNFSNN